MAFDRSKYREQLMKRTQESFDQGDYGTNLRYFKPDMPFPLWNGSSSTKDKPHMIDIIPFIAGINFPLSIDRKGIVHAGDLAYFMRVQVHQSIGPNNIWVVCPAKNYDDPCPICEDIDLKNRNEVPYESFKDIAIKQRCVYYVICYDSAEEEKKGLQIFEASYKFSEKEFKTLGRSTRTNEVIPFSDPDIGASIAFHVGTDEYKTPYGFHLEKRDYVIDDEILELARNNSLDNFLIRKSYEELKKLYYGKRGEDNGGTTGAINDAEDPRNYKEQESAPTPIRRRLQSQEVTPQDVVGSGLICKSSLGTFGVSTDNIADCPECNLYEKCADEMARINSQRQAAVDAKRGLRRRG